MKIDVPDYRELTGKVLAGEYCIGCGVCTAVEGSPFQIRMNRKGQYEVYIAQEGAQEDFRPVSVCPFSEQTINEDQIGRFLFAPQAVYHNHIGYYLTTYAGYVAEGKFRELGSSGGVAKWILYELLRRDKVDAVIQVTPNLSADKDGILYKYSVSNTLDDVLNGSKSAYYPVEMSEVLAHIRKHPGRYVITGVPCFVKAIRLLSVAEPIFKERIVYTVGLVCGHLKSKSYAEMIGWQLGVPPGELTYIDFRKKIPGKRANQKGVEVKTKLPLALKGPDIVQNLFGTNYNHGFFQYHACNFCDDVVGETADISVGDAWLPEYLNDGQGTSVVVIRQAEIARLVEGAIHEKRLAFQPLSPERVVESQAGGFRQRREGLAYRLQLMEKEQQWYPPKRVKAGSRHLNVKRKKIYQLRMQMTSRSHELFEQAKKAGQFKIFQEGMQLLLDQYQRLYRPTVSHRIQRAILRRTHRWLGWPKQI
ncbi:MAG: coenzyme F420 hydrogenase [Methanosarcinales archaeon]|nr:MAG: coenzyme F420 hydrogenase [Methanosarcinales archaeon]